MKTKTRGSEKLMFNCDKNGKRSLAEFENVEEALKACGGVGFNSPTLNIQNMWWRFGIPAPHILQNFRNIGNISAVKGIQAR